MDFLKKLVGRFIGFFGVTDALSKEHQVQETIVRAALLNTVIQALTLLAHTWVKDDITLRIFFETENTRKRVAIATFLWLGIWVYMVRL